jgi:hypothetical protein
MADAIRHDAVAAPDPAEAVAVTDARGEHIRNRPARKDLPPASPREIVRPHLVEARDYRRLQDACTTFLNLVDRAERAVRADADLLLRAFGNYVHLDTLTRHLAYDREVLGRFDVLVDGEGRFRFLEYNPALVGGAFESDELARDFRRSVPGRELDPHGELQSFPTADRYVSSFWDGCFAAKGKWPQRTALILASDPIATDDGGIREIETFIGRHVVRGGEVRIVPAWQVIREDGQLKVGDWPVDAAVVMDWQALLEELDRGHPLLASSSFEKTWMADSLGSTILRGGKHILAVLSDEQLGIDLSAEERAWIDVHIPWTRMMPVAGSRAERDHALLATVERFRNELVLKPTVGRSGGGVVAGWTVDDAAWRAAIEAATRQPYIVQRRVDARRQPGFWTGASTRADVIADLCPFVWQDGAIEGLWSRASTSWLLNMGGGGATAVPVFVRP